MRLQQDGSSGFTPQTWDVAGNEANFFVRDATSGSTLPFRIEPGAPTNAIVIDGADGEVGMGTNAPTASLHVRHTDGTASVLVEETNSTTAGRTLLKLKNNGGIFMQMENTDTGGKTWTLAQENASPNRFLITSGGTPDFILDGSGNVTIEGSLTTGGTGACSATPCDAVFDPAVYTVPSIEDHAAFMWENKHLPAVGPTGPDQPINMTEKMLRMLNELEHAHIYIEQLHQRIEKLELAVSEKG